LKAAAEWFKNTPLLPQRVKSGSIPGFAALPAQPSIRFFHHSAFASRNIIGLRVFKTPSLSHNMVFHHGKKDAYKQQAAIDRISLNV
jgi:hypothetical protein